MKKYKLNEMYKHSGGHPIVFFDFEGIDNGVYGIEHRLFEEFGQNKSILKDGTVYEAGKKYKPKTTRDLINN